MNICWASDRFEPYFSRSKHMDPPNFCASFGCSADHSSADTCGLSRILQLGRTFGFFAWHTI